MKIAAHAKAETHIAQDHVGTIFRAGMPVVAGPVA